MDIHNPLKDVCRGVEADILNHLIHFPHFENPSTIARAIGRSKSETIKCLHGLSDGGIITRASGSGRQYGLTKSNAVGFHLLKFADFPALLARDLSDAVMRKTSEPPRPRFPGDKGRSRDIYPAVVLAPEEWCRRLGLQNVVVIVLSAGESLDPYLRHEMLRIGKERFGVQLHILEGPAEHLQGFLHAAQVPLDKWPLCRASKGPQRVWGADLLTVLRNGAECGD